MGSGIAEVAARAGVDVAVLEPTPAALDSGRGRIEASLAQGVKRGKLSDADEADALARISFSCDPASLADRQLVVEAIPEVEELKLDMFRTLDAAVESADAVLASNTSSVPIMKLAMATKRPERAVGIHFF